jgi:hypothetical protein
MVPLHPSFMTSSWSAILYSSTKKGKASIIAKDVQVIKFGEVIGRKGFAKKASALWAPSTRVKGRDNENPPWHPLS